jgi:phytoene desaturase
VAKVVVVGAGVAGLAVAARLSSAGHAVTLCERSGIVGGKLGVATRVTSAGTFNFSTGPSLLTMPHVLAELFAATGEPLEKTLTLQPVEPSIRYRFADGSRLDASSDLDVMCRNLDTEFGGAGAEWRALMDRAERIWRAAGESVLTSPVDGPTSLLRRGFHPRDVAAVAPGRSLRQVGAKYLRDPHLRVLLDRYATYVGSDPRRAPAAFLLIPYLEQTHGAWYVVGGLRRIADALAERVRDTGADIRTGAEVEEIEVESGRAAGVRLADGARISADVVVAGVDARHLYTELATSARMQRRLSRLPASLSGFQILFGVRGRTPGAAAHNVFFPADYDAEFDAIFGRFPRPVSDPAIYVNVIRDPAVCPPDHEAWQVLVNAPVHGAVDWDNQALRSSYADRIAGALAARGLQTSGRSVFREIITPADLARGTRSAGGAIYGSASNGTFAAFFRPPNRTFLPGLFHVGGSTHPGGGLPMVAMSARIVADLIGPA